ncbi:hypothetical protein [Bosea sp. ANAM02]|uniref:hypothetical protein n=1 Tax=Bosea sp. ANAM02 TaxID=2020412 RepID=UPI00140F35AF|nr:hypothetical protein [Bosea sp. ANAM02]BCB22187.1 hypothetical protein OCUBac02_50810 [Bosea sp. ANAM02]
MQPGDIFDVEAMANAVSAVHAGFSKFQGKAVRGSGPLGLASRVEKLLGRVQNAVRVGVADAVRLAPADRRALADHELYLFAAFGPFQDDRSRAIVRKLFPPAPPPPWFRLPEPARYAAVSAYGKGIALARASTARVEQLKHKVGAGTDAARLAAGVVPSVVTEALRSDARRVRILASVAVLQAGEAAKGLAMSMIAHAENAASRLAVKLAPLGKFISPGAVFDVGDAGGKLFPRALRTIAIATGATAAFTVAMAGNAHSEFGRPVITGEISAAQVDAFWGGIARQSAPQLSVPAGSAAPVPSAANRQAQLSPGGGLPPAMPSVAPRADASIPSPAFGRAPAVATQQGDPLYPGYAPTAAFIRFAVATAGVNTQDHDGADRAIGQMIQRGMACMSSAASGGRCSAEYAGVSMDFATGRFTATLAPIKGVSFKARPVATETPDGIRVTDQDALNIVLAERESNEAKRHLNMPDEDDNPEDKVAPTR